MNPVEIGGILHVRKSDMEIAYSIHNPLEKEHYDDFIKQGLIVEDLA